MSICQGLISNETIVAPRWSPAIFCIGINDLWFVSLTWEFGTDEEPWVYLEDDYGYQFDESAQIALMKARRHGRILSLPGEDGVPTGEIGCGKSLTQK